MMLQQLKALNPEERDRVTISLFGTQQKIKESLLHATNELDNVNTINMKLAKAAREAGRLPPQIVISVLIIPDWESQCDFTTPDYIDKTNSFFESLRKSCNEKINLGKDEEVKIENFYTEGNLEGPERAYLEGLVAKGSNADMIKTHAIISETNATRRHLQMDSNTKIYDFQLLYNETFGNVEQRDALNASFYDPEKQYVSAHNKIVYTAIYTPARSPLALALKDVHLAYCELHKDDHTDLNDPVKVAEKKEKNSIYSKDFVVALEQRGLTQKKTLNPGTERPQVIYLAVMDKPEYRITKCIATAVNMSWSNAQHAMGQEKAKEEETALKQLPAVQIRDALCDYVCFANAVLKYTATLFNHGDDLYDDTKARRDLLAISNQELEKEMIKTFVEKVKEENPQMLEKVINTMMPHTQRGKEFFMDVFGCPPEDYEHQSAVKRMRK